MNLPVIGDPLFYLIVIPAAILLRVGMCGFAACADAGGGTATLMPVLVLMGLLDMMAFRKGHDFNLLQLLLPFGLLGIVVRAAWVIHWEYPVHV